MLGLKILKRSRKKRRTNKFPVLYCPETDVNELHVFSRSKKLAICSGCGEVIRREKEINFRKKLAKAKNINRFKAWSEGK